MITLLTRRSMKMYQEMGYSKEFFNVTDAQNFFADLHSSMKNEVGQMSDNEIISCN